MNHCIHTKNYKVLVITMYLIIIFVHASIISLKDELLLEVHVAFILDVFREPLFWAIQTKKQT